MNADSPSPGTISPVDADPLLLRAVAYLLRPLARLLIARGVTYPTLAELLKRVYLQVCVDDYSVPGHRLTDSRVSLLTGLHRKDVRRLREEPVDALEAPHMMTWGSRLVSLWLALPEYCDGAGEPRPLSRLSSDDPAHSFESLAARVTRDIGARAILDELVRNHVARVDEDDRVHLEIKAFVPRADEHKKLHFFANNLHDHLTAAVHNLLGLTPTLMERSVEVSGLSDAEMLALERLAERQGMNALVAVNESAQTLNAVEAEAPADSGRGRIRFGVYFQRDDGKSGFSG
jgi:hypothetical protein